MKFKKISDNKIKIIVSLEELKAHNILVQNIFENPLESQALIQTILRSANLELGFNTDSEKVLVEILLASNDEYIFTITNIFEEDLIINKNQNYFIYKFSCFDDILSLFTYLKSFSKIRLNIVSDMINLYIYKNTYYLYLFNVEKYSDSFNFLKFVFLEFGEKVMNYSELDKILKEYGKIILNTDKIIEYINK